MGNACICSDKPPRDKIFFETTYLNIKMTLIKGDITDEATDSIVNASDFPYDPQSSYILKKAGNKLHQTLLEREPLKQQEVQHSLSGNLKSKYIIHAALPEYTGGNDGALYDLKNLGKTFVNIFQKCNNLATKSISFTDCLSISQSKQIPQIFAYSALMMALAQFLSLNPTTKLEQIKYVSSDELNLRNLQFEIEKKVSCSKNQEVFEKLRERDRQFFNQDPIDNNQINIQIPFQNNQ